MLSSAALKPGTDAFLAALGVLAAFCLVATPLAVLAMISIIGLPLALLMALVPPVFVVLLVARLIAIPLETTGVMSRLACLVLALAVLAIPPFVINAGLDRRAADLVAADIPTPPGRLDGATIALRLASHGGFLREETRCDDLCQRMLLSGAARRVLMVTGADVSKPPDAAMPAISFRLETRPTCPIVHLRGGVHDVTPAPERPAVDPSHRMRLAIAEGRCLIEETAALGEADSIVSFGPVAQGKTAFAAGFDPFADTVRASRLEVFRKGSGGFEATYRRTYVRVERLAPILVPSYVGGTGLDLRSGFVRLSAGAGASRPAETPPDVATAVTTGLGSTLKLPDVVEGKAAVDVLATALSQDRPVDGTVQDIARDLFEGFVRQPGTVDEATRQRATRVLSDLRFPVNRHAWALVKATRDPAAQVELARILFQRLRTTDPRLRDSDPSYLGYPAAYIGTAIAALPASAIRAHRGDLEWLARQRDLRVPAWPALKQLHVFGPDAVPTLLFLIDDALAVAPKAGTRFSGEAWQHPTLAGLMGLCLAGADAHMAAKPLLDRAIRAQLPTFGSYRQLLVRTLVATGADPDAIWSAIAGGDAKERRDTFDRDIERFRRRPDCSY